MWHLNIIYLVINNRQIIEKREKFIKGEEESKSFK